MKKNLFTLFIALFPLLAFADAVEIDGIYYNLVSKVKQAEVTSNPNNYTGSIVIPETVNYNDVTYNVTSIGIDSFKFCYGLTSVTIPNSVTSIGSWAFWHCENLTSVIIPNSVTYLGEHVFDSCSSLTSVTISSGVTRIMKSTFQGCSSLTSIIISDGVTDIEEHAFDGCSSLTSIIIPNSVTFLGKYAFNECSGLTSVTISSGVTRILSYAFSSCSSLTSVTIPNNVTDICNSAFESCSNLTSITIGSGVELIESLAFAKCPELTDVFCYAKEVPNTYHKAFDESFIDYATLHVPATSINLYKTTEPWMNFMSIVKIDMPQHTLTYLVDGEVYKTYQIEEEETITPEEEPTKEGYTFSGWSEIPETMPAHDVTITGTFSINSYKLIYQVDGEVYKSIDVEYGETITPEDEPTKEGYTFSGWSEIPETMPAHDVTITGAFSINSYNLTYQVDGEVYKSIDVEYGAAITPENDPTKEGYTFSGWSEIPETMPAHDVTITGAFSINSYKLTYQVDGEVYKSIDVEYGETITPEDEPTKEGYTFSGWSELPETMPAHDVTIIGTFSINSYKLTYMIDNEVYKEARYKYGETITPEPQPEGNYETFEWVDLPETMPAHDVVVYANYTTTGIADILKTKQQGIKIYSPNGKMLDNPQKGLNIIRMNDGSTRKVVIK